VQHLDKAGAVDAHRGDASPAIGHADELERIFDHLLAPFSFAGWKAAQGRSAVRGSQPPVRRVAPPAPIPLRILL
jgi:hypothetical protein